MRSWLLLILLCIASSDADAQSVISGGVWGGVNFSRPATYPTENPYSRSGFTTPDDGIEMITNGSGGVDVGFQMWDNAQLSLGFYYVTKGVQVYNDYNFPPEDGPSYRAYARDEYSFVEVPLLVKYSFTNWLIRPYLIAGPSIGIFGAGRSVYTSEGETQVYHTNVDDDLGLVFGVGFFYPWTERISLHTEVTYTAGLTEVRSVARGDAYSQDLRAMIGIRLNPQKQ